MRLIERYSPSAAFRIFNKNVIRLSHDSFGSLPAQWRLNEIPPSQMANPIVNDKIADLLYKREVEIVLPIRKMTKTGIVELTDGRLLPDVDTIILCTGYHYDFSLVPNALDPTREKNPIWDSSKRTNGRELHRLYQGFFSLECPDSLVFLGVCGYPSSQMPLYDLITMAVAQVWKGAVNLPPKAEMKAEVNKRHAFLLASAHEDGPAILPHRMNVGVWMKWLHDTAGTGFNEKLTYEWKAWWNWIWGFRYISNFMTGVNSPHLWRLFEGRRKKMGGCGRGGQAGE